MCRSLKFSPWRLTKHLALVCGVGLTTLGAGCSQDDGHVPVFPVKGKVSVAGEVPEGALIVFYPVTPGGETELRPSAKVKPDGSFSLTTYDADDGAPSGEYTATIQWNKIIKSGKDFKAGPDLIPKTYAQRDSSVWKVKVAEAPNELEPLTITK